MHFFINNNFGSLFRHSFVEECEEWENEFFEKKYKYNVIRQIRQYSWL